jgi:hypothetical protein
MCDVATNLAIDEKLLAEAQVIGGNRTKKATVNEALKEYILRRKQTEIIGLFGRIPYADDYDYKKSRARS